MGEQEAGALTDRRLRGDARRRTGATLLLLLCALAPQRPCPAAAPEPPPVVLRDIGVAPRTARGTSVTVEQSTVTLRLSGQPPRDVLAEVVLFLPDGWTEAWKGTDSRTAPLTLHFHGAPWFAVEEHARRGARNPLLAFYLGEGASMYEGPVQRPGWFDGIMEKAQTAATEEANRAGAFLSGPLELNPVEIQSFSAGYGAVRQLLRTEWKDKFRRVVLADSLYASLTTATVSTETGCAETSSGIEAQIADPAQMAPFVEFARRAAEGETQFLLAHSTIRVTSYADTVRTADALICALGGKRETVTTGTLRAAEADAPYPLESRFDRGGLHIWGYRGATPKAHMAVARTIAEFWTALDAGLPARGNP